MRTLLLISTVSLLVTSCCDKPSEIFMVPEYGWTYDTPALFPHGGAQESNSLTIRVAHTPKYQWENLYIHTLEIKNNDTLQDMIMSIPLMHQGEWLGEKCCDDLVVRHPMTLKDIGSDIHIYQHSREPRLDGVVSVGLER